jgi:CarD family transcriptional regulator
MPKKTAKPASRAKAPKSAKNATRGKKKTSVKRKPAVAAKKTPKSVKKPAVKRPAARKPAAKAAAVQRKPAKKAAAPRRAVVSPTPAAAVAKTVLPKAVPPRPQPAAVAPHPAQNGVETRMNVKKPAPRLDFKTGEHIVYPAHGVGRIVGVETQEVAGIKLDLFVISFIKDKMTLRVPTAKATSVGMRKLADNPTVKRALETVRGRARIKRTMWSRRAQEYEAKINSGDLISIAEVVRDLYRSESQPEQSYSERQLYEAALDRMSREISSVNRISETEAIRQIEQNLAKSPRRGPKPEVAEAREEAA